MWRCFRVAKRDGQAAMTNIPWHERLLPPESRALIRRFKATLSVLAIITIVGVYTAGLPPSDFLTFLNYVGVDIDSLQAGRFWTLLSSTFVQSSPGVVWHMMLMVIASLGSLEYLIGSGPALLIFVMGDWVSSILTVGALWVLSAFEIGSATRLLHLPGAGSSAAAYVAGSAACVLLGGRWGRIALALVLTSAVVSFAFLQLDIATAHLVATAVGAGFGCLFVQTRCSDSLASIRKPDRLYGCTKK